jgi:hypothetical protein
MVLYRSNLLLNESSDFRPSNQSNPEMFPFGEDVVQSFNEKPILGQLFKNFLAVCGI